MHKRKREQGTYAKYPKCARMFTCLEALYVGVRNPISKRTRGKVDTYCGVQCRGQIRRTLASSTRDFGTC